MEAAAQGYVAVDHRFLHAILDHPKRAIPDLVRFAAAEHDDDALELEPYLIDIFRCLQTPQAVPFFVSVVRQIPSNIDDDLVEAIAQLGEAAVDPLLTLLSELGDRNAGDLPFLLSTLHVRDPRILDVLTKRMSGDALEAKLAQIPPEDTRSRHNIQSVIDSLASNILRPSEPPEPFDIWGLYPESDLPALDKLSDDERLAMLEKGSPELRVGVAESYGGSEPPLAVRARLLELAKSDPDMAVRGACWEALGEISDEPEVRRAMLDALQDSNASIEEKGGAAVALAHQADNPAVVTAIETLYDDPRGRAKALKAIARSLDRRFASYPPKHLDDPDLEIKRQAIWGVGYLGLASEAPRLEPFLDDNEFRSDALFAYALSIPGETSRSRAHALLNKIEDVAGGFRTDEEMLVQIALDQRLMLHGIKPVFFPDESDQEKEPEPIASSKVGRNDPCPCGSGKKYKKCCGA